MGCDCVKLKDFRKISELTVVPTYGCQFGCTYCFVEDDSPSPVMSRETLDRAIDFFIPDKVDKEPRVWFFGGEPLLHKGLLKHGAERAKSVAERHGMAVTVGATTNGHHLDEDFARWCVENGFRLLISYDGHRNQRVFRGRAGRREEDAATVEDNVRRLFSLRGGKAIAPTAALQVPPGGISGLYEEVMSAFDLGFTSVALNRVNGKAGTYSEEDLEDLHVELGRLARFVLEEKESGGKRKVEFLEKQMGFLCDSSLIDKQLFRKGRGCGAAKGSLSVGPSGHIYPCQRMHFRSYRLGNVLSGAVKMGAREKLARHDSPGCESCGSRCVPCYASNLEVGADLDTIPESECRFERVLAGAATEMTGKGEQC